MWWVAGLGQDDEAPSQVSHFVWWLLGIAVAVWMMTSDLTVISMLGLALLFTCCGGTLGWVQGYSDRDLEAKMEVLLRENSIGKN